MKHFKVLKNIFPYLFVFFFAFTNHIQPNKNMKKLNISKNFILEIV